MSSEIPIANIYYLLCYAWNQLREGEIVDVSELPSTELADLFGRVLINGTRHLQRRGLEQAYVGTADDIRGVRGRIDFGHTARRMLLVHGYTHCQYDELTANTLPNQIIKATLRRLYDTPALSTPLRKELYPLYLGLQAIANTPLQPSQFRRVQLHSNNRFYRFLLNVCELIMRSSIPDPAVGGYRFRDFLTDEGMPKLFEAFIRNFYRHHLGWDYSVRAEKVSWSASSSTDPELRRLPQMLTDITLRSPSRTVVIDAKFYPEMFAKGQYGKPTYRSIHLYQLLAYITNLEADNNQDEPIEGILIYPQVGSGAKERYTIGGHSVQLCTLDLAAPWQHIHKELLEIADERNIV